MNFLRRKRDMMQPPDLRRRKADIGSTIVFCLDKDGMSPYWAHVGHSAKVISIELRHQSHRPSPRAIYLVACECGKELKPRSPHFQLL